MLGIDHAPRNLREWCVQAASLAGMEEDGVARCRLQALRAVHAQSHTLERLLSTVLHAKEDVAAEDAAVDHIRQLVPCAPIVDCQAKQAQHALHSTPPLYPGEASHHRPAIPRSVILHAIIHTEDITLPGTYDTWYEYI